ncbi:MAG TPA: phosphotransferase [Actinomycetes bacterium]
MTAGRHLRDWVRADFGVDLASVDAVSHGADVAAQLWRAVAADGTPYAVKLTGGGTTAGLLVTAHLAELGVDGVAAPVRSRDGHLWTERAGRRLSVAPWVSDAQALAGGMSAAHWRSFGALLSAAHATVVTGELADVLPREDHTHDGLASLVRDLDARLHESPDGADDVTRAVADAWCAGADRVALVLAQADRLGAALRGRDARHVVCHGDPHLGNLLVGDGGAVWLVDWDDAVLAPPERDLMFVVGGLPGFAPVDAQQRAWFFEGYAGEELDQDRLVYYRSVRALVDAADWAAQAADPDSRTDDERARALTIVRGVLAPDGLVELALAPPE